MVGVVVVTHADLARELVGAATLILGPMEQVEGVGLMPDESEEAMMDHLNSVIARVDNGDGVLMLVDMFGGTPSNLSLRLLKEGRIEVVTGVNLPMLLKVGATRKQTLPELARVVRDAGARNIFLASEFLKDR